MRNKFLLFFIVIFISGCSVGEIQSFTSAAMSKNPSLAFKTLAKNKAVSYSTNPKKLQNDLKRLASLDKNIEKFILSIIGSWGKENAKVPQEKEYVKYMQNYKSRALIDFDRGIVTVETMEQKTPQDSLKNAIVTTLLLPDDPRAVDLFGSNEVKLGGTPYLLGEIKDDQNKDIRYQWRAKRYATILLRDRLKAKTIQKDGKSIKVTYVDIPMVKDHANIRVAKFKPLVRKYAKRFNISENLIYAIIQTESNFNQFAVSGAGAIGLMQVVPTSAGKDAYKKVKGKSWTPSRQYLFNAEQNIELGSAYIQILNDQYLKGIYNPISKEYCVISAYNTGSGNVLKTFSTNRTRAREIINGKKPSEIYSILINKLPYTETRKYLQKVVKHKKLFVNI